MWCPDCKASLDEVAVSDPCPACGGRIRSANAAVETIGVVAAVGEVSLKVTRGDDRPWTQKWLAVIHSLDALRDAYGGDARLLGSVAIDSRVESFFVECDHLRDWLVGDVASLSDVVAPDIEQHFTASQPLLTCNKVCNTHKHHTRRSGTTARIRATELTPTGARVTIEVDWATSQATTVDALDLAQDCVTSRRAFFTRFGIAEP